MNNQPGLAWLSSLLSAFCMSLSCAAEEEAGERPVDGIADNSFLVEEAYNQEKGVVQHILTGYYAVEQLGGPDYRNLNLAFTQEWPVFSQDHQFSYTIPYNFSRFDDQSDNGLGDVLLNYRYQAYFNEKTLMALAPRASLILPTGDKVLGYTDDTVGFQANLPFSTALGDRWYVHLNAGLTYLPDSVLAQERDLLHYSLGSSLIYAATADLHFMLEWVGYWIQFGEPGMARDYEFSSLISPGVRKAFNFSNGSQLVLGLAAPIGITGAAPDFGAFFYASFEHFFSKSE